MWRAEILQSLRAFPKLLLLTGPAVLLTRWLTGPVPAVVFCYLIFLPLMGTQFGVGMFAEEIDKGPWRYFASWPVTRGRWLRIKLISVVLHMSLLVGLFELILAAFPEHELSQLVEVMKLPGMNMVSFIGLVAADCAFCVAGGLVVMLACRSMKLAAVFGQMVMGLPFAVIGLAMILFMNLPGVVGLIVILLVMAAAMMIGAWVMFQMRNPFLPRPWTMRGWAALFLGLSLLSGAVSSSLVLALGGQTGGLGGGGVQNVQVAPDGKRVLVSVAGWMGRSKLLLLPGGAGSKPVVLGDDMYGPRDAGSWLADGRMLLVQESGPTLFSERTPPVYFLAAADGSTVSALPQNWSRLKDELSYPREIAVVNGGRALMCQLYAYNSNGQSSNVIRRYELASGRIQDWPLPGDNTAVQRIFASGTILLQDYQTDQLLFWRADQEPVPLELGDTEYPTYTPDGRWMLVVVREARDARIARRLIALDFDDEGHQYELLGQEALSPITLEQLSRNKFNWISVMPLGPGRLVRVTQDDEVASSQSTWLIDMTSAPPRLLLHETQSGDVVSPNLIDARDGNFLLMAFDEESNTPRQLILNRIEDGQWKQIGRQAVGESTSVARLLADQRVMYLDIAYDADGQTLQYQQLRLWDAAGGQVTDVSLDTSR